MKLDQEPMAAGTKAGTPTVDKITSNAATNDHDEPGVEVPEAFHADNEGSVNWVVRKISESRAYAAHVRDWAEREVRWSERDEAWLLGRFSVELEDWLRSELARRGGRRRSVALPAGTLGLRVRPAGLEIEDEAVLLAWCGGHLPAALHVDVDADGALAAALIRWADRQAEAVRMKRSASKDRLRQHLQATGELPDGTVVRPAQDQLYIK